MFISTDGTGLCLACYQSKLAEAVGAIKSAIESPRLPHGDVIDALEILSRGEKVLREIEQRGRSLQDYIKHGPRNTPDEPGDTN